MSTEDALFRAMRASAKSLLTERLRGGDATDLEQITEQVLDGFRPSVDFSEHAVALRVRIKAFLEESIRQPGNRKPTGGG